MSSGIHTTLAKLLDRAASEHDEVREVGRGKLVVTLADPDGNVIGLSQEP